MSSDVAANDLSAEQAQQRAQASAHIQLKFGQIAAVLMRSPQHRQLPLSSLEALVVPPLLAGQILVAEATNKEQGFVTPIGAALWALVSSEVDERLSTNLDQPLQIAANEWKSGDIPWLIALAGDQRVLAPLVKGVQQNALQGKPLKMRTRDQDGNTVVTSFTGEETPTDS